MPNNFDKFVCLLICAHERNSEKAESNFRYSNSGCLTMADPSVPVSMAILEDVGHTFKLVHVLTALYLSGAKTEPLFSGQSSWLHNGDVLCFL
jgi:hypothetical protein